MRIDRAPGFPAPGQPGLFWLGQAGFWIDTGAHRILIDPYLSDSLAIKYAGKPNDHKRMMPAPIGVEDLPRPDGNFTLRLLPNHNGVLLRVKKPQDSAFLIIA